MPKYKKKITNSMDYQEFKKAIESVWSSRDKAFLTLLFFAGCRVSEALALTEEDIRCDRETIYVQFFRLKGSKQTDPTELPRADALLWICEQEERIFSFSRTTAYRIVKRVFPELYPHYFRMNRITMISNTFSDAMVYSFTGICAQSIDHYRGKVDIKKIGKALREEL